MQTRRMAEAEALQNQIAELTAKLEEQRLQMIALEEARKASESRANIANAEIATLRAASATAPPSPGGNFVAQPAPVQIVAETNPTNDPPRIPDLIRLIPEFDGNPRNLPRWIESVEQKLTVSKQFVSQTDIPWILPIWLGIIRDKITDKANDALSASHTPLEWDSIKAVLIEYFGDKSDLSSLISKMSNLKQGSNTVIEFYHKSRSLLAEINAKISLNNNTPDQAKAVMATYDTLMKNAFVDGLHDKTSDQTRSGRPQSLMEAYHIASEHEAATNRRQEKNLRAPPQGGYVKKYFTPQQNFSQRFPTGVTNRAQQGPPNTSYRPPQQGYYGNQIRGFYNPQNSNNSTPQQNSRFMPQQSGRLQIKSEAISSQSRQNNNFRGHPINYHEDQVLPHDPEQEDVLEEDQSNEILVDENSEQVSECENLNFHTALSLPQRE